VTDLEFKELLLFTMYIYNQSKKNMEQVGAAVTLYICIREMLSSNLGRNTGYPVWYFPQSLQIWGSAAIKQQLLPLISIAIQY
jgi:hypothetical protein